MAFRKKSLLSELLGLDAISEVWDLSNEEQSPCIQIRGDIEYLASLEEIFWRQKSRVLFVKEGDNNTRFFHRLANFHRRANQINNIEVDGVVYEDEMEVRSQVVHFYQVLYQEIEMRHPSMDGLDFSYIEEDEKLSLERVFSKEEVI